MPNGDDHIFPTASISTTPSSSVNPTKPRKKASDTEKKSLKKNSKTPKEKKEKKEKKQTKEKKEKKESKKEKKRKEIDDEDNNSKKKKKKSEKDSSSSDQLMQDETICKIKQVRVEFTSLGSKVHIEEETLDDDGTLIVDGLRLFEDIDWGDALDNHDSFYNFNCSLVLSTIATETSLTVQEFISSIEKALKSERLNGGMKKNMNISHQDYIFEYDSQNNSTCVTFNRINEIEEISGMLNKIKIQREQEEDEEIESEMKSSVQEKVDDIQVNFEFKFENDDKKFALELKASKQESYKTSICENLQLDEKNLSNYSEKISETLVEASGTIPIILKGVLSSRLDVKVVHRHVFYEQRVISYELFERMKDIIGQCDFDSYNHLDFLICAPDMNTLWHQTMERLERSNILPPNIKPSAVSIKHRNNHVTVFEKIRDRIENEKETLFIVIVDECHTAITKEGAHDKIVNDSFALKHNNFFVLLVSATPYNILSVDSNVPEVYKLVQPFEDLQIGTKVKVHSTKFHKPGLGVLIKTIEINSQAQPVYEFIPSYDSSMFEDVQEIVQPIEIEEDKSDNQCFKVGDIVECEEIPDSNSKKNRTDPKRYRVRALLKSLEKEIILTKKEREKIKPSKTKRRTKQTIGEIKENQFIEIHDTIKWYVSFKKVNGTSCVHC